MTITCGYCGHTDAFETFTRTPIRGELFLHGCRGQGGRSYLTEGEDHA